MSILDSLLTAIMRADGDALVLHVGERPYVVTKIGNVDLAKTILTVEAVSGMLAQLIPAEQLETLAEVGAVEHQLQPPSSMRDAFTVIAARGGDDIWIEVRRKRPVVTPPVSQPERVTESESEPAPIAAPAPAPATSDAARAEDSPVVAEPPQVHAQEAAEHAAGEAPAEAAAQSSTPSQPQDSADAVAEATHAGPGPLAENASPMESAAAAPHEETLVSAADQSHATAVEVTNVNQPEEKEPEVSTTSPAVEAPAAGTANLAQAVGSSPAQDGGPTSESAVPPIAAPEAQPIAESQSAILEPVAEAAITSAAEESEQPAAEAVADPVAEVISNLAADAGEPPVADVTAAPEASTEHAEGPAETGVRGTAVASTDAEPAQEHERGTVVPLTRVIRVEVTARSTASKENSVERLLTMASARGGELVYLTSQSRPFLRIEGGMRPVENEPVYTASDIEAILAELMPESARELHGRGDPAEWMFEHETLGRVRCATFYDRRGPGLVFHLTTTRPMSAEQLALGRDIQALAGEPEGLVLVSGPRGSGKSTLVGALIDLINRQHSVSVISIERQVRIVHDNRLAMVSQRETRGADDDAVVRSALRESPDVLVLEDLQSPEAVQLALDAAATGRLVILSVTAGSTVDALTRIVDAFPASAREAARTALAERLRGAISQVLLRKIGGGKIAAREILISTPETASAIAQGQWAQLSSLMAAGRKHGMVSLNEVLASLVKNGSIDASEAYRRADNRDGLLARLEHDGVDTSLVGRLA
jgi:twitching motility protein PilT